MHRNFSFPLLHCYSAMDVLQMQMQHCNKYQNNQDLSLPSGSDILPIYWSCRASAIYDLPINLRYIHKRVPSLVFICSTLLAPQIFHPLTLLWHFPKQLITEAHLFSYLGWELQAINKKGTVRQKSLTGAWNWGVWFEKYGWLLVEP